MDDSVVRRRAHVVLQTPIVVEHETASGLVGPAGVTGDAASLEDWTNIAVVFDIEHILGVTQSRFVVDIPLLARLIALLVG